jgi:hypothetical protein
VQSTQPSNNNQQSKKSILGGHEVSQISIVTATGFGNPMSGADSKSSFKFGGGKKVQQSTNLAETLQPPNLMQKSSESALSQIPHRQRAALKKSTPVVSNP